MRNVLARRIVVLVLVGVLALGVYQAGLWLANQGIDQADKVAGLVSAVIAVLYLLFTLLRQGFGWARGRMPITNLDVARARDDLARGLDLQWAEEERLRRVYNPRPLPVRWEATDIASVTMPGVSRPATGGDVPARGGGFDDVLAIFSGTRRVVVLGPAGAGKSVLIMKLARELVAARQPGDPVPVIVPAGVWDPSVSLPQWVTTHLINSHPGLATQHRSATGETGTLAHLLVSGGGVLPVLDGLDELPESLRSAAIEQINEYGSDRPLVVTSRPNEYTEAVSMAHRMIARASVVELCPLRVLEVKEYLLEATASTPDARWNAVLARLDAEPNGPLTEALTTPLLLWLARTIYEDPDTNPAELADVTRFATREAIEHHLLDTLVPAVYAPRVNQWRREWSRYTAGQAQRWLAFLAAHLERTGTQQIAWWRLAEALRGADGFGVVLRLSLLGGSLWALLNWLMERHGDWRDGVYFGSVPFRDLLLGGELGRRIRPTIDPLLDAVAPKISNVSDEFFRIVSTMKIGDLIIGAAFVAAFVVIFFMVIFNLERERDGGGISSSPKTLRFSPLRMLAKIILLLAGVNAVIALFFVFGFIVSLVDDDEAVSTLFADVLMTLTGSQLILLGATVLLLGLPSLPAFLAAPIDVSREVNPVEVLRLDRRADLVVTILQRIIFGALVALLAAPEIAVAYALFAVAATLITVLFGGFSDSRWREYTQARQWLFLGRRLPWRTMAFLSDAHQRGVLRRVGAVYQFRHIRLQERLAARHPRWRPYFEPAIELAKHWSVLVLNIVRERIYEPMCDGTMTRWWLDLDARRSHERVRERALARSLIGKLLRVGTPRVTGYPAIDEMLDLVRRRAAQLIGQNLIGVYLHGSLTTRDFDQYRSDVDLLFVGQSEPDHTTHDALLRIHEELRQIQQTWADRVDMEYTSVRALGATTGAVPVTPQRPLSADTTPLLLRYALLRCGVPLIGPSPCIFTHHVSKQLYVETFRGYFYGLAAQAWDDATDSERLRAVHIVCRGLHACRVNDIESRDKTVLVMPRALRGCSRLICDATGWRAKAPDVAGLEHFFAAAATHPALVMPNEPTTVTR